MKDAQKSTEVQDLASGCWPICPVSRSPALFASCAILPERILGANMFTGGMVCLPSCIYFAFQKAALQTLA